MGVAFEKAEEEKYFPWLHEMYYNKREKLVKGLNQCGLAPTVNQGIIELTSSHHLLTLISLKGSYFILANTTNLAD